jgi:hypothetical protein
VIKSQLSQSSLFFPVEYAAHARRVMISKEDVKMKLHDVYPCSMSTRFPNYGARCYHLIKTVLKMKLHDGSTYQVDNSIIVSKSSECPIMGLNYHEPTCASFILWEKICATSIQTQEKCFHQVIQTKKN